MRLPTYALALVAALALTGAPEPGPRVSVDRAEAKPGEQVLVRLTGWPGGTVLIELCGADTPARCAVDSSAQIHLPASGGGGAPLAVAVPPGGCPCQVRVTTLDTRLSATAPLAVTGALPPAGDTARQAATRPPTVIAAHLERADSWTAYFGAPARRTLVLRLRNEQSAPATVAWSFSVGRGPDPTGFVTPPEPDEFAVGEEREIRVPVTLPALAVGDYQIHGEIVTAGATSRVTASTDHQPWGLAGILGLVTIALAAVALRRGRGPHPHVS
ncbi:hypothetical protein AB0M35_19420 [Micromonospora sp. NPDC051196]|uniref:hypothetical protein n=1 Tax=Micromonospora sp. NPDC051196 TaxID=3155281 RepID=UPI0034349F48